MTCSDASAEILERGIPAPKTVTDDAVRHLQLEVDKLKERLDFMAPLLSLMNFTQDFFQKIECESSVQLTRLRNAKLTKLNILSPAEDEKMVETAKWLNVATDVLLGLSEKEPPGQPPVSASGFTNSTSTPISRPGISGPGFTPGSLPSDRPGSLSSESNFNSRISYPTPGYARMTGPPLDLVDGRGSATNFSIFGSRRQSRLGPALDDETTLEFRGFSLGKGTWANAYRQATGTRREALSLLCKTGIVTERELADDLTVINETHIEECVLIASEMLQRWPSRNVPPPIEEAKTFFEERLAALYMRRAPSPFSHD